MVECTDIGRFQGETDAFFCDVEALFIFAQPFLLLHAVADICAINGEAIPPRVNASINPAAPRPVKDFELIRELRFHGAMTTLIEFAADRFGKNFPDQVADQFFSPLSGKFQDAVVYIGVAPIAIKNGESVANTGKRGLALDEQITDCALMLTCSRR